tara:strand:+ start:24 stop:1067 length:1044 start_codon:yes stop_codon:yes gene_type:complete
MKTFQQFQIDAYQLDEGKLALAKMAFKGLAKTPILKKIGTSITKTPIVKKVGNVIKNLRTKPKPSDYVRMYHGTTEKAAKNILKKGMKGSSKNPVSDGVYDNSAFFKRKGFVTNDPEIARQYTMQHQYDGKKPDIVALKVLKKNLKKGTNPGEYTAPVKDIKPVARGVKPIETRKGQVMQEARVEKLILKKFKLGKYANKAIKAIRNRRAGFTTGGITDGQGNTLGTIARKTANQNVQLDKIDAKNILNKPSIETTDGVNWAKGIQKLGKKSAIPGERPEFPNKYYNMMLNKYSSHPPTAIKTQNKVDKRIRELLNKAAKRKNKVKDATPTYTARKRNEYEDLFNKS